MLVVPWKSLLGWLSVSISPKMEEMMPLKNNFINTGLVLRWGDPCLTKAQNISSSYHIKAIFC
jgi:hypothetical protein